MLASDKYYNSDVKINLFCLKENENKNREVNLSRTGDGIIGTCFFFARSVLY